MKLIRNALVFSPLIVACNSEDDFNYKGTERIDTGYSYDINAIPDRNKPTHFGFNPFILRGSVSSIDTGIVGATYLDPTQRCLDSEVNYIYSGLSSDYTIDFKVENCNSGSELAVKVFPGDREKRETIFLMQGGFSDKTESYGIASVVSSQGYTIVLHDPDGRGESEGVEHANGLITQDGLYSVIQAMLRTEVMDPYLDENNFAVVGLSYGTAATVPTVARYSLEPKFLLSWEPPVTRECVVFGCEQASKNTGSYNYDEGLIGPHPSCDDEEYWQERVPTKFLSTLIERNPTTILSVAQSETDHAQDDPFCSLELYAGALNQGVLMAQYNDMIPNIYVNEKNAELYPDELGDIAYLTRKFRSFFDLERSQ